ncbi:MAG TPA: hypothetical protein GXX30_08355 [Firmicutes bacterium]|nr:hypothetical protein [Candidatus Fermentithermobacillaceae bacterium]
MKNKTFWDGLAMGGALGILVGALMLSRRMKMTPMTRTKMIVGRTARHALRRAQGTLGRMVGRFSD